MGWFLWGIVGGWAACAIYYYSQIEDGEIDKKVPEAAWVVFMMLAISAVIASVA